MNCGTPTFWEWLKMGQR